MQKDQMSTEIIRGIKFTINRLVG